MGAAGLASAHTDKWFSWAEDWSLCVCMHKSTRRAVLTLGEAWWVVVHVWEGDADRCGSWEPAHLSGHVFSLDHNLVVFFDFPVHARQGCLDQAWGERKKTQQPKNVDLQRE